MTDEIVEFLIEHSPEESGPVYLFLADHWEIVQSAALGVLSFIVIVCLTFVAGAYAAFGDS